MPHHLAVPALLQRTRCVLQKPVLAPLYDLLLLRSALARPTVPHLLPPTLFAPPRRELRALAGTLLMASYVLVNLAAVHCTHV
ncbi:hypothetical protein OPT61_g5663 [Boeremia exigua]|uniref:Uncharacterized protein n=1 Tax=Boeremia exigua TaxID=749465 RepID=A0ACC2I9M3_9PLEO|nr:hypothetical protein OPT61_g5663 [Boeremia exigua]